MRKIRSSSFALFQRKDMGVTGKPPCLMELSILTALSNRKELYDRKHYVICQDELTACLQLVQAPWLWSKLEYDQKLLEMYSCGKILYKLHIF